MNARGRIFLPAVHRAARGKLLLGRKRRARLTHSLIARSCLDHELELPARDPGRKNLAALVDDLLRAAVLSSSSFSLRRFSSTRYSNLRVFLLFLRHAKYWRWRDGRTMMELGTLSGYNAPGTLATPDEPFL
jgi:hypothetical protein